MRRTDSFVVLLTDNTFTTENPESASVSAYLEDAETRNRYESLGPVEKGLLSLTYFAPQASKEVTTLKLENFLGGDKVSPVARFQAAMNKWCSDGLIPSACSQVTYIGFDGVESLVADLAAAAASWGSLPWVGGGGSRVIELDYASSDWVLLNMAKTSLRKVSKDAEEVRQRMEQVKAGTCSSRTKMSCLISLAHWRGIL